MRRWLVVIEDPRSEFANPEELEVYLKALWEDSGSAFSIARVQRGGLLAERVMGTLPPVRHEHMGRPRA